MMAELAVYESDAFPQNTMRLDACLTTDQTQYTVYNSKGRTMPCPARSSV